MAESTNNPSYVDISGIEGIPPVPMPEPTIGEKAGGLYDDITSLGKQAGIAAYEHLFKTPPKVGPEDKRAVDPFGRKIGEAPEDPNLLWTAWQNYHPVSYAAETAASLAKLPGDIPKITSFANSLQRGTFLWSVQDAYNEWKAKNPNKNEKENPYAFIKTNDFFRDLYVRQSAVDQGLPFGLGSLGQPIRKALFNQYYAKRDPKTGKLVYDNDAIQDQVYRDMYIAGVVGNHFSYVDQNGQRHWDTNAVFNTLAQNPIDTVLMFTPLIELGAARGAANTARLASAFEASTAAADAARAAVGASRWSELPLRQKAARIAEAAANPVGYAAMAVGAPALARTVTRTAVRSGIYRPKTDIYSPEYTAALNDYKDAEASRLAQEDIERQYTQHGEEPPEGLFDRYKQEDLARLNHPDNQQQVIAAFNESTGNKFANPYSKRTNAILRQAGITPGNMTSYEARVALENAVRSKGGLNPAIAREAVLQQREISPTTSAVTGAAPSALFGRQREQAARTQAQEAIGAQTQSIFRPDAPAGATAQELGEFSQANLTAAAEDLRNIALSSTIPNGAKMKFGGADAVYDASSGTWKLGGTTPRKGAQEALTSAWFDANPAAKTKAAQPIVNKALEIIRKTPDNPEQATRGLEGLISDNMKTTTTGGLPGDVNLAQITPFMSPEGQAALNAYTRSQIPNMDLASVVNFSRTNPNLLQPGELNFLRSREEALGILGKEVPAPSQGWLQRGASAVATMGGPAALAFMSGFGPLGALTAAGIGGLARKGYKKLGERGSFDRLGAPVYLNPASMTSQGFYWGRQGGYLPLATQAQQASEEEVPQKAQSLGINPSAVQAQPTSRPTPIAAPSPLVSPSVTSSPQAKPLKPEESNYVNLEDLKAYETPNYVNLEDLKAYETPNDKFNTAFPSTAANASMRKSGGRIQRKSGGQVTVKGIEPMVQKLILKARQAKAGHGKQTEPLLDEHDNTITKALDVAQRAI